MAGFPKKSSDKASWRGGLLALLATLPALGAPTVLSAEDPAAQVSTIAALWSGNFDNHRQVDATLARGGAPAPELTRERRRLNVVPIRMPQLGTTVLFLEEYRETNPAVAHRQRVVSLSWDGARSQVRAEQWFFADLPTYDRAPADPAKVRTLPRERFRHEATCDLYFTREDRWTRWRGSMDPMTCKYPQGTDGIVYAEFDMLLRDDGLWYRDRSIRTRDGSIRGEIDGFSWLLFDRLSGATVRP
jgi:hypothetical protein